jgi:hypothetical protein
MFLGKKATPQASREAPTRRLIYYIEYANTPENILLPEMTRIVCPDCGRVNKVPSDQLAGLAYFVCPVCREKIEIPSTRASAFGGVVREEDLPRAIPLGRADEESHALERGSEKPPFRRRRQGPGVAMVVILSTTTVFFALLSLILFIRLDTAEIVLKPGNSAPQGLVAAAQDEQKKEQPAEPKLPVAPPDEPQPATKKTLPTDPKVAPPLKPQPGVLSMTRAEFRKKVMTFEMNQNGAKTRWGGSNQTGWDHPLHYWGLQIKDFYEAFGPPYRTQVLGSMGALVWRCSDGEARVRWKEKDEETINFIGIDEP